MTHPPRPKDPILTRVRERLKARIEETGISHARLARRAGVSVGTIRRLTSEDDVRDIFLGTLASLASVLLMDVWELLEPMPGERWVSAKAVKESTVDGEARARPPEGDSN